MFLINMFHARRGLQGRTSHPLAGSVSAILRTLIVTATTSCLLVPISGQGWASHHSTPTAVNVVAGILAGTITIIKPARSRITTACDSQIDFETRNPMTRVDQSTSDSFNWTLASGATASGNNTPKVDQTTGTGAGRYIYMDASGRRQGD
eukprot:scpid105437/ scgid21655/ 